MPSKAAYFLLPVSMFFCTVLACGQTTSSTPHATLTVETANTAGISEKLTDAQKRQIDDLLREQSQRLDAAMHNREVAATGKPETVDEIMSDISARIHAVVDEAVASPQQDTSKLPSAPGVEVALAPQKYGLRPTSADYSSIKGFFPMTLSIFAARQTPSPAFLNMPRLDQLLQDGKLMLSLDDAIALGLENNLDLAIARYNLDIADADLLRSKSGLAIRGVSTGLVQGTPGGGGQGVTGAAGGGPGGTTTGAGGSATGIGGLVATTTGVGPTPSQFDPTLSGTLSLDRNTTQTTNPFSGTPLLYTNTTTGNFQYLQGFSPGTTLTGIFNNSRAASNSAFNFYNPLITTTMRFQLTQHLLQGFGTTVNRRFILLAQNNRKITDSSFRQQVIYTVSQVEDIYWDLVSAYESVRAAERAVAVAQELVKNNERQVRIGTLAPIEVTNAQAQVASANQNLIIAHTNLQYQQLLMKNAISRNLQDSALQAAPVIPTDTVSITSTPEENAPVDDLIQRALKQRPEIEQAQFDLKNREINRKGARNALRPVIDAYGYYGATTLAGPPNPYARSCAETTSAFCVPVGLPPTGYWNAFGNMWNDTVPDKGVGINVLIPIRNRAAESDQIRAQLEYHQAELRLEQLENQIRIQVRNSQYALQQDRARVEAAQQALTYAQQSLDAEQKRYKVGASTVYNIMTQENNVTAAENSLIAATTVYAKDRVTMDQMLAQTLDRNHIALEDAVSGQVHEAPIVPDLQKIPASQQPSTPGAPSSPNPPPLSDQPRSGAM
ncbi:MAG TPA: TolC family protein [Terriglobales bacterium]|nr:TolC family protein [Terriglobales bacterium]